MLKTLTAFAAAAAFAVPAFAQDMNEMAKDKATDMAKDAAKDAAMDAAEDKANAMAKDAAKDMMKAKMKDEAEDAAEGAVMDTMNSDDTVVLSAPVDGAVVGQPVLMPADPVVVASPEPMPMTEPASVMADGPVEVVNVACPSGTTAQPDGTCLITGDFAGAE